MVYDLFCFFNELDVLEERLDYLVDAVDFFVICESNVTHVGTPKRLYFKENYDRFNRFKDKIIYLTFKGEHNISNPWINENCQRNYIMSQLQLNDQDKVIISDVDEIPSKHFLNSLLNYSGDKILISIQEFSFFQPNCRRNDIPYWSGGSRGFNFKNFENLKFLSKSYSLSFLEEYNSYNSLTKVRLTNIGIPILNGGWHLSYMGGENSVAQKLLSFAHTEESLRIGGRIDLHVNEFNSLEKNFFGKNELYIKYGTFENRYLPDCTFSKHRLAIKDKFIWIVYKYKLFFKIYLKLIFQYLKLFI